MVAEFVLPTGHIVQMQAGQLWVRDERGKAVRVDWIHTPGERRIEVAILPSLTDTCEVVARAVASVVGVKMVPVVGTIDATGD